MNEAGLLNIFENGGPVMYPLAACSVIVLAVILERAFFWLRSDFARNRKLLDEVLELSRTGRWDEVRQRVHGSRDFVVRVLISGILHRDYSMGRAMEAAAADELRHMARFMGVLDTMITVAPLLGIFGTVLGIIDSFDMLAEAGIGEPRLVTAGIAQALITTAYGLGIAILSVFPFNYFNSRLEKATLDIEKYATSLEIVFEKLQPADPRAATGREEAK